MDRVERLEQRAIWRYCWLLAGIILIGSSIAWLQRWRDRQESRQDAVISAAAHRYGVPAALVKAVVWQESRFKPYARGKAGELGLMQVSNLAAQEWAQAEKLPSFSHRQLLDPAKNALAGTWYLGKLLKRYAGTDDPLPYALADYNAGRSNVRRWIKGNAATNSKAFLERIDFPSTRKYVESVRRRYEHYQRAGFAGGEREGQPVSSKGSS